MTAIEDFIPSLTSPLGVAIITAVITTISTWVISNYREYKREKKQEKKQREFKSKVVESIRIEIKDYLENLDELRENSETTPIDSAYPDLLQIDIAKLDKVMFKNGNPSQIIF